MSEMQGIKEEHERRFVPDMTHLPFAYETATSSFIEQSYLEDELKTRIRKERTGEKWVYTRTRKSGTGISRPEDECEIQPDEFAELWGKASCRLTKTRYFIRHEGVNVQLNIYHEALLGYVQIEVEFDTAEAAIAFTPPSWLGREVTDDSVHGNFHLAKYGKPE